MSFLPEIKHVVYINLDERTDRRAQVEKELEEFGERVKRFSAIKNSTHGGIGCVESHIQVLKNAKAQNWDHVLIIEDDFVWKDKSSMPTLSKLMKEPYDVILLAGTYVKCFKDSYRLYEAQTTTAYVVSRHYYDILLANFEEGLQYLKSTTKWETYALDQYWKQLQHKDRWFIVLPGLATQRTSFSDIQKRVVNYAGMFV